MSWEHKCDICGEKIGNETWGALEVSNFNDGYNTEEYNCSLDICQRCLFERIDKNIIAYGREEF